MAIFTRIFRLAILSLLLAVSIFTAWGVSNELEQDPAIELPPSVHVYGAADAALTGLDDSSNLTRLIPRELFFENPDKYRILNSLDGKWISYMAPYNGVLNVWIAPLDNLSAARPVTNDTFRGIQYYTWTNNDRQNL